MWNLYEQFYLSFSLTPMFSAPISFEVENIFSMPLATFMTPLPDFPALSERSAKRCSVIHSFIGFTPFYLCYSIVILFEIVMFVVDSSNDGVVR